MVSTQLSPGRVAAVVTLLTVAIFGGLVGGITWQLRQSLREEVLRREAEALHSVTLMQLGSGGESGQPFADEDQTDAAFTAALESSRLRGVLAVQLFDSAGVLRAALPRVDRTATDDRWWPARLSIAAAQFSPTASLESVLRLPTPTGGETSRVPLVDVVVPLNWTGGDAAEYLGVARYWMDGGPVAAEFARMDRRLAGQAGIAFAGGAGLVALVLIWAFARLNDANRRLVNQSADLARANEELDFAAKTGALGAISAHLIHGLKNPLAGIEGFVHEAATGSADATRGEACRAAMETTRRLRGLVSEVTTVLRDEEVGAPDYPVPAAEVVEAARIRARPAADTAGIILEATAEPTAELRARASNLAGLILSNLLANATEAAPTGSTVTLAARRCPEGVEFLVRDAGPGLPPDVRRDLFRPVRSTKRGGGGVGLAISHRLAKHAGGDLTLVASGLDGTTFRLVVFDSSPPK